jgi:hypothetical protein
VALHISKKISHIKVIMNKSDHEFLRPPVDVLEKYIQIVICLLDRSFLKFVSEVCVLQFDGRVESKFFVYVLNSYSMESILNCSLVISIRYKSKIT